MRGVEKNRQASMVENIPNHGRGQREAITVKSDSGLRMKYI